VTGIWAETNFKIFRPTHEIHTYDLAVSRVLCCVFVFWFANPTNEQSALVKFTWSWLENGCPYTIEAKWMFAVVPLYHGGRIPGRSANCCYLPRHLRHKAERNRVDCTWFLDGAEMCPIRIVLGRARSRQPTTNNKIRSRCDLFDFYLGRGRPRVCFTGNVHICSCSSMYRGSGVSFAASFSVVYDRSFSVPPFFYSRSSPWLVVVKLVLLTLCTLLALSVSSVISLGLSRTCEGFDDGVNHSPTESPGP